MKYLHHVELKLEKLKEFKYSAQDVLLEECKMRNLEEWSRFMEEKMVRFDYAVDRFKSAISKVDKKEEAKAKHEENIIQEEMFTWRMQQKLKIQETKLQMKFRKCQKKDNIVNEERVNVKLPKLVIQNLTVCLWTGPVSRFSIRVRLTRLTLVLWVSSPIWKGL